MPDLLLRASLEGALLAAVVWVVVRAVPRLSPGVRAALWWCATAKFVVSLVWIAPVEIPVLRPAAAATPASGVGAAVPEDATGVSTITETSQAEEPRRTSLLAPTDALALAWYAGLAGALLVAGRRCRRTASVLRNAVPAPANVQGTVAELATRLALPRVPRVLVSAEVQTPLVAGIVRPVLLVPDSFAELAPPQQHMALCHELAHVRRGDLWIGCVPALAERLFFFHPLARFAAREYAFWRESACDAEVLETLGVSPREYARLLLDLGVARPRASLAAAGASWSFANLQRRICMLTDLTTASRSTTSRLVAALAVALTAAAVVPLRLVARASEVTATVEPAASTAADPGPAAQEQPRPPAPPVTPAPPAPAAPATPRHDRQPRYVVLTGDDRSHMSGTHEDVERARSFRKGDEPLLWFKDARGEFVIRDPAMVREVEKIWSPVGELGARQGRLGAQQGALGARMGELGAKQGGLGAAHASVGARHAALGLRHAKLASLEPPASEARRAALDKARQELDEEMRAIDREIKTLNARMREFEKPMRELSAEMEALGREMDTLGKELEQAATGAEAEMQQLFDRAIASGAAEKVKK